MEWPGIALLIVIGVFSIGAVLAGAKILTLAIKALEKYNRGG